MEISVGPSRERAFAWIVIIGLAGLIIRIAESNGALWLDEAQSAIFAAEAESFWGIFKYINHDNNHHLNSVWLQIVGLDAPPLAARALSVVCGAASVVVAGLIGLRRGAAAGLVTAALFAFSPALVTLGSEARGYAAMTLMVLISIFYVDRWLDDDSTAERPLVLVTCFYVGILFQMTMLAAICAILGWALLVLWHREGLREALPKLVRLFALPLVAAVAATLLAFGPAVGGSTDFRFGSHDPFTVLHFLDAVIGLIGYSVGVSWNAMWLPMAAMILVVLAGALRSSKLAFYSLAIVAFPLALAALQAMNIGHPRYFLLVGIALLLLLGEGMAAFLNAGGWKRLIACMGLAFFVAGSAAANYDLYGTRRGDPGAAIRAMAARAPEGADLLIPRGTGVPLIRVAAAEHGYRIRYTTGCPARPFLFLDWFHRETMPSHRISRCGTAYRAIASAQARGMSGHNWTLYERSR